MVQGGDPTGTGRGGESIYGEKFADEITRVRGCSGNCCMNPETLDSTYAALFSGNFFLGSKELEKICNSPKSVHLLLKEPTYPLPGPEAYWGGCVKHGQRGAEHERCASTQRPFLGKKLFCCATL